MNTTTRRRVLGTGLATAAGLALPRLAIGQAGAGVETTPLADDLYLLTVAGINVVARTGPDGVVLVDGGPTAAADGLEAAIAGLPGAGPITTLFNSHWHPEQTGLNERIGAAGGTIIAQQNTQLWLATDITYPWDGSHFEPLPEIARPNRMFFDAGELAGGIEYGYLKHAPHTDGDLYVKFADANVLVVGDGASGAGWPFVDWWTGGWIGGIVGTMELLLALTDENTRVVPARGRMLTRADLEVQYEMYNTIYSRLAELLNRGRGPDEAVAARPTAEYDGAMGPSDEFVRRAFESLWAYLSPDA